MSESLYQLSRNILCSLGHHISTNRHYPVYEWSLITWYEAVCSVEMWALSLLRVRVGVKQYTCLNQDDFINTISAYRVSLSGQAKRALIIQNSNRRLTGSKTPSINQQRMFQPSIHTPSPTYARRYVSDVPRCSTNAVCAV